MKRKNKTWKISESGGYFQILTHENYEQTNGIQLEFFYTSPMLEIVQQTKKKKTWKISESWGYFQILTNDNYEQTNGIQLEFFYTSPMLRILQ